MRFEIKFRKIYVIFLIKITNEKGNQISVETKFFIFKKARNKSSKSNNIDFNFKRIRGTYHLQANISI